MADEYVLHGDVEAACIQTLIASSEIANFNPAAPHVASDMVGYTMGDLWIMVSLEGGTRLWPRIWKPRVDVQVLANTRTIGQDLAQVAEAVLFTLRGVQFPSLDLVITGVKEETGMFRAPDQLTGSVRYIFALRLTVVPM